MASRELQGWQPDPFGLHEMRYFSVGQPTKLVRDGRVDSYDEPPGDRSSVGAVGAQASAVGSEQTAGGSTELPATASSSAPPFRAAMYATTLSTTAVPRQSDPSAPTGVLPPVQPGAAATVAPRRPVARPVRRRMEYVFVALGAVVAVLVFVTLGGGSGKPGLSPAAYVTKAAQRTLVQHTANFTLTATGSVQGQTVTVGGRGRIDIAADAMSMNLGASTTGGSFTENEIEIGGNSYLEIAVNGHSLALSGGRHWIEEPFAPKAPMNFATTSPESSLALLAQQGAKVTSLGSQSIGGQNCNGYSVIPSSQALVAGARQEMARIGMSAAETNAAVQALQNVQPPTITAWFGTRSNLACRVTFSMQFGTPASTGSDNVECELTFTHYGAPVRIASPAPSDVVDLQQFLQGAARL